MADDKTREEFEPSPHNNEHSITSNQVLCEKETGRVVAVFYNDYDLLSVVEQMQAAKELYAPREVELSLDERMKAAGMMPVSVMLERNALGKFSANVGVTDLKSFEKWVQVEREQFIKMQAEMTLGEREDEDLFEWAVAHNAVLGEVMANFRQATKRGTKAMDIGESE